MTLKNSLYTFLATVIIAAFVTWPLPRHLTEGIASSHRPEAGGARRMIAGDHLQLLYYFQLMSGFISGETPWFRNLYEFNFGDDEATFTPDFYYAPFSIVYTALAAAGGEAFGWNMTGLLAFWLGLLATWLLVRRFKPPWWAAVLATAAGVLLPYRWITFLHGSPTGFAMSYVPLLLLGLDIAIRDKRVSGGILAGLVLLLAGWADTHTFFFSALLVPFWCVFVFVHEGTGLDRRRVAGTARGLAGFVIFGLLVVAQVWAIQRMLDTSSMAESRDLHEVMIYSPAAAGFFSRDPGAVHGLIYITYTIPLMLAGSFLFLAFDLGRGLDRKKLERLLLFACLLGGVGLIMLLSLGPRMSPAGPVWWDRLCRVFPPYGMIRQPAKIFSILPPLVSVLIVLPFSGRRGTRLALPAVAALVLSLALLLESAGRLAPTVSILDGGNSAYEAIAVRAGERGEKARALAVVLWPGDTHWSSLYQYYGAMHRVRMVNGYRPNVSADYFDNVFRRFAPLNQGYASDDLLDELLDRGIRHLVLHEDAFPEKPSPFGVAQTLSRFLAHPRLSLLEQDRSVWAFAISETAAGENVIETDWPVACPTMVWDLPRFYRDRLPVEQPVADALGGWCLRLSAETPDLVLPLYPTFARPTLRLALRVRGEGTLHSHFLVNGEKYAARDFPLATGDWTWLNLPFPEFAGFAESLEIVFSVAGGRLDLDQATMLEGETPEQMEVGSTFFIPASSLFHAGYSRLAGNTVVFEPAWVAADEVLYGPRFSLPSGAYTIRLLYQAPGETLAVGRLRVREPAGAGPSRPVAVIAGRRSAELDFEQKAALPVVVAFHYNRKADMTIEGLEIIRRR